MNIFVFMISVTVIGYGNVAYHLVNAFLKAESIQLVDVYARDLNKLKDLKDKVNITNKLNQLKNADVYIIAVSDDVIPEVSSAIQNKSGIIVHTSGAVPMNQIHNTLRKGVFYPLQSFSKEKLVNFNEVPFCLETENNDDFILLEKIAKQIGKNIYSINSNQRKSLHVAAVFVNNFTNHLFKIGNDICNTHHVPFEVLLPLIQETTNKIKELAPEEAQTGPAKRNDQKTIANHLSILNENQKTIYKLLTKSIQNG